MFDVLFCCVIIFSGVIFDSHNHKKKTWMTKNILALPLSTAGLNERRSLSLSDSEQLKQLFPVAWMIEMLLSFTEQTKHMLDKF